MHNLARGSPPPLPGVLNVLAGPLDHFGYWAVLLLVMLEDFGIPVPGETVLIAASVYAGAGRLNVVAVGVIGFAAAVVGDNIGFAIGRFGGRALILRWGRYVRLTRERLDKAEAFFDRHGAWIITVARFIEVLRQVNGLVAGVTGMRWLRFLVFNALGAALWVGTWVSLGYLAGTHIGTIYHYITEYSYYVLIALAVLLAGYIARRMRRRERGRAERALRQGMPKAVRYDGFGGIDVLRVEEVERPVPGDGQVLVRVKAAGINISEAAIRTGAVAEIFPSTFPSGQGSDLAGVIEEVGAGIGGFSPGDEVIGFSDKRASQAELVLVESGNLTRKPEKVSWEAAGGLYVAGVTAWGAVHAVQPKDGETVVISGAAGGVGSVAVQLARRTGAAVIGLASESNHQWLKSHGVIPVAYGHGVADRIEAAAPGGVDAFIDTHGDGYVELALALGVAAERIDTIADFPAAQRHGVKTDGGAEAGPSAEVLAELAGLIADGHLEVPIANVYPLAQVREAYTELERRHTRGKIVLRP